MLLLEGEACRGWALWAGGPGRRAAPLGGTVAWVCLRSRPRPPRRTPMRDSRCWYFLVASSELGEGVLVFKGCANYRRLPAAGRGGSRAWSDLSLSLRPVFFDKMRENAGLGFKR